MKAVVTGGAGFIGSHLTERLIHDGHQVTVIDNLSTGRLDNLKDFKTKTRLRFVKADISEKGGWIKYFKGTDWVFHLAALADIVPSIVNPLAYHKSNVDGTVNVLEAAKPARVKKILYAASSSCYGIPDIYPTPETAPIRPQYPYALTKNIGEQYVMHWGKIYGLPVVSLRLFNVYGPRSRTSGTYGAVFGVFLAQKLAGKPFTVVGDGNQTRDFTFVTDVADAFITAAQSDIRQEIMNVGSGGTYKVNTLVDLLSSDMPKEKRKVIHIPKRPGEPDCTLADISKIRKLLGWKPKVPFEEGVKEILRHIDYWRKAPVWTEKSIGKATREWFKYLT